MEGMIIYFVGSHSSLGTFDYHKQDIRVTGDKGVYELVNDMLVFESHVALKAGLMGRGRVTNSSQNDLM